MITRLSMDHDDDGSEYQDQKGKYIRHEDMVAYLRKMLDDLDLINGISPVPSWHWGTIRHILKELGE